jgi:O-antigen/teichoic acid export membrane protein
MPLFALTFDIGLTIAFWIPIVTIVESFREIFNAFMRGFKKFEFLAFTRIINAVVFFVLVIIFLFFGWGIIGALLGKILATLITTLLHAVFLVMKMKTKFVRPNLKTFRTLFSFGKVTYVNYFLVFFRRNSIIVLLAYLWGSYFVGIYSAALLVAGILSFVGIPLTMVLFPSVSSINERNIIQKIYSEGFQHVLFFTGPITVGLIFFASDLIRIFLGEAYFVDISITIVFSFLCIAHLIEILLAVPEPTSLGLGRPDLNFWSIFIGSLVALVLGYILTSLFNYIGAAVAYMISFFVSVILLMFFLKQKESLHIKTKKLYPIITGVSIMAVSNVIGANIFPVLSILIFVISILLYIVINLKEGVIFDEINFLKTILRKSILNSKI